MTTTWILTANASEAHLFESPKAKLLNGATDLEAIGDFEHPESRKKRVDLIEGSVGRYHSKYNNQGTFNANSDPKLYEAEVFARELVDILMHEFQSKQFQELIIVAPPQFHGLLNKYLSHLQKGVAQSYLMHILNIEKDYTKFDGKRLVAKLQHFL